MSYDSAILLAGIYPRELKMYVHKNRYMHVHNSFIHNSLKVETTQMIINEWVDKQNVVFHIVE